MAMVAGLPTTVPTVGVELPNDTEIGVAWGPRVAGAENVRVPEFRAAKLAVMVVFALKVLVFSVEEFRYTPDGSRVYVMVAVV